MVLVEGCKHSLEISVPVEEVESETERVVATVRQRAKLPGFRPGKAPVSLIRRQFQDNIRRQVLEELVPKAFRKQVEREELRVVGNPDITEVHFEPGKPLRFKAEFEVEPAFSLGDYRGISVAYQDPQITDEDVSARLEQLRDQKADYANVDPRPIVDGDYAVVALESIAGVSGPPIKHDELMLHIGAEDTLEAFTENLRGLSPGDKKEFDVSYPENYAQKKLAGRTVRFRAVVKGIRQKELPELNDDFAQDVGDYRTLDELREALRKSMFAERQYQAQREAKNKIVEALVDAHNFPVPEAYVDRQIRRRVEESVGQLVAEGVDPASVKIDWDKAKGLQRDKALREVKASLILSKIAEREAIDATREEVDREVERIARQQREPVAAVRLRFEKDGTLGRIAYAIQTEKVLNFLFEHAQKVAES